MGLKLKYNYYLIQALLMLYEQRFLIVNKHA